MRKLSYRYLTEHVNLVKWEEHKKLYKFSMLTIHSLLLNGNPKFIELRAKVEMFNSMLAKGVDRKHLQFYYIKKLYEMLRYMVNIKVYERQQEFLEKVYAWAHGGRMDNWEFDCEYGEGSKSRPTTATTRTRPFSAYSRPKSGYNSNRMAFIKLYYPAVKIKQYKKTNPTIDYEKLKSGDVYYFTGQRTLHPEEYHPMKKLKYYQRKVFYDDSEGSDLYVIDSKEEKPIFVFKNVKKEYHEENVVGEGQGLMLGDGQYGYNNNNQLGDYLYQLQQQEIDYDPNNIVDDLANDGYPQYYDEPYYYVVDKLKPRLKAFIKHDTELSKNQINYFKGKHHLLYYRNKLIRKTNYDDVFKMKMIYWAKYKSRTKREQKRRAESARIATKKIGITYKESNYKYEENVNVINLTNFPIAETKNPLPKTAFKSFNENNRKYLIKNCFITGAMYGHIQKFYTPSGFLPSQRDQRIVSLAYRPKKKTFEYIIREAEMKVKQYQDEYILNVKYKFARSKVAFYTNRIAKSITYHAGNAEEDEYYYEYQLFGGGIIGMNMMNNPFFKVGKKKKKKKKKK